MSTLSLLREANPTFQIHTVDDPIFSRYARLLAPHAVFLDLGKHLDACTVIQDHNVYEPDLSECHTPEADRYLESFFGGLGIQIGYCNGKNQTMNGFEYHKGPELTIAVTDLVLFLSLPEDLKDFDTCPSSSAQAFFIPAGTAFLLKPEILHLSPCEVTGNGFKSAIILPKGTNLPLDPSLEARVRETGDPETRILFKTNKWMISHRDRKPLVDQGVHIGLTGENRRLCPVSC